MSCMCSQTTMVHICTHTKSGSAFICAYWDAICKANVTNQQIWYAIKYAAKILNYSDRGMPIDWIDMHLL